MHFAVLSCAAFLAAAMPAEAQRVRVRQLTDLNFGTLVEGVDRKLADSLCVFSTSVTRGYRVTATGSGPGGVFALASGGDTLPLEVQWAFSPGATSGVALAPGVARSGTTSNFVDASCSFTTTATLIVILREEDVGRAPAGNYSGTLNLLIAPN